MEPILFKPKNMHQKTFDRLRKEADHASHLSWIIMGQRLGINITL
jgi:ribosomal protein S25